MEGTSGSPPVGTGIAFKDSTKRVAHEPNADVFKVTAKLDAVVKATKRSIKKAGKKRTQSDNEDEEDEIDAIRPIIKPTGKVTTVLSGFVQNEHPIEPQTTNDGRKVPEEAGPESLKVKLNWGSALVTRLRPKQPKPESLNEDTVYLKRYRRAHLELQQMEALKTFSKLSRRNQKKPKIKIEKMDSDSKVVMEPKSSATNFVDTTHAIKGYDIDGEPGYEESPEVELRDDGHALDWDKYLQAGYDNLSKILPVTDFPLAPLRDVWDDFAKVGLAVEIRNCFVEDEEVYWIGTIVAFAGYKALVRLEDFHTNTDDENYMSWISFCSSAPKHLGWAKENSKILHPGCVVKQLEPEELLLKMKEFCTKPTIRIDHLQFIHRQLAHLQKIMKPNSMYEAIDHTAKYSHRLVKIKSIVGNRMNVLYYAESDEEAKLESWFDYRSSDIRRFMWAHSIGALLKGVSPQILANVLDKSVFPSYPNELIIKKWMRLETVHPKSTHKLVGAVIVQVLRYGYFILRTNERDKKKWKMRLYHVTSPFVLPVGFAKSHGVEVDDSLEDSEEMHEQLNLSLLPPKPDHPFKEGGKIEAVFTLDPDFVGPATIKKVAGHMLYVHYDGWSEHNGNYQWIDAHESEIYPAGYCEMLNIDWKGNVDLE